jgi:ferric-dicitrate binding protein FerR (iron transport regulator)
MEQRFWLLLSLKFSNEASLAELEELDVMLQQQPELFMQYEVLKKLWEKKNTAANTETPYDKHLQRLSNHLSLPALQYENEQELFKSDNKKLFLKKGGYRKFLFPAVAAAALIVITLIFFLNTEKKSALSVSENTITTKPGSKSKVQLPDGTLVWLNADSKIAYDDNFQGKYREVQLSGEAYFEVTKDKEHPFIIHTKTIDIKVLGTVFNVRSYDNEKTTETSLIKGSVEITIHNAGRKIVLKPNEKLVVQNSDTALSTDQLPVKENSDDAVISLKKIHIIEKDSSASETLWIKNKLAFDNEPLEEIALKIERWYDVHVVINSDVLKNTKYSAIFEDESLSQVMEALKLSGNFKYTINKKEVIIEP